MLPTFPQTLLLLLRFFSLFFFLLTTALIGSLLKAVDIGKAFIDLELSNRVPLDQMPASLRTDENWHIFWSAISALWNKTSKEEKPAARLILEGISIAFGDDALWAPSQIFSANQQTRDLFSRISDVTWFNPKSETSDLPNELVPVFNLDSGIDLLKQSEDILQEFWASGLFTPQEIFFWIEGYRDDILESPHLREQIRLLKIWPTADGKLKALDQLYLTGDFEDPLKLAELVDIEALGGGRDFLEQVLEVRTLDFVTYVRDWLPRIVKSHELDHEQRIQLLNVLAEKLGTLRDYADIQRKLRELPIVWCGEEEFYAAPDVYFYSDVTRAVLGSQIVFAKNPAQSSEAIRSLYKWLGVVDEPRPDDIVNRVQELTSQSPTQYRVEAIQKIFGYLAERWQFWDEVRKEKFASLKKMAWLPGSKEENCWCRPDEVYANYRSFLYESQGNFLVADTSTHKKGRDLIIFLGINREPNTTQVVRHLLHCAKHNLEMNHTVYSFLNDNVNDPAVKVLKGERFLCLKRKDGVDEFFQADQVFWGEHLFGHYRFQLPDEFFQYRTLFDYLGVKSSPDADDAIKVLIEISNSHFAKSNQPIEEGSETEKVIISAWKLLSENLETNKIKESKIKRKLGKVKTILNNQKILYRPDYLFFEDRPGWGEKFEVIKNNRTARIEGAWLAMEAAGVQRLSRAVITELHECIEPQEDIGFQKRFLERKILVQRVLESHRQKIQGFELDPFVQLSFTQTSGIEIVRTLKAFNRSDTQKEEVDAVHIDGTLYYVAKNGGCPWASISRELAYVLYPPGDLNSLGMELKEIFSAESAAIASDVLDEYGYTRIETVEDLEIEGGIIQGLGGADSTGKPEMDIFFPDDQDTEEGKDQNGDGDFTPPDITGVAPPTDDGKPKRKATKLVSYVYPKDDTVDDSKKEFVSRLKEKGQLGVDKVMEYEKNQGREPTDMETIHVNNPGFDIKSIDPKNPGQVRYIEVKTTSGMWDSQNPAQMHKAQFEMAQERGESYWLYIVEQVEAEDPQIYCIQNPANQVNSFMFDHGWQPLADGSKPKLPVESR